MPTEEPLQPSADRLRLLEETHQFPCEFMIKVIGLVDDQFFDRVVSVVRDAISTDRDIATRVRQTPNGKHIAVTLEPCVASAEEVLAIYRELKDVQGVVMMM